MSEIGMGRILAIETSGAIGGVAIVEDGRLLGEAGLDTRRCKTEMLLETARRLLSDLDLKIAQMGRIAFSEGPGSFTGLRVGMAAAIGIAYAADRPLVAVPSLEVLAYPWRRAADTIAVLSGHRRGHLYVGVYQWMGERFHALVGPANLPDPEAMEAAATAPGERLLFVGDALDSLRDILPSRIDARTSLAGWEPARAVHTALLAMDPDRPGWVGGDREGRTPLYLRDADARKPR